MPLNNLISILNSTKVSLDTTVFINDYKKLNLKYLENNDKVDLFNLFYGLGFVHCLNLDDLIKKDHNYIEWFINKKTEFEQANVEFIESLNGMDLLQAYGIFKDIAQKEEMAHYSICAFIADHLKLTSGIELSKNNISFVNAQDIVAAHDNIWVNFSGHRINFSNFRKTGQPPANTCFKYDFDVSVSPPANKTVSASAIKLRESPQWGYGQFVYSIVHDLLLSKKIYDKISIWRNTTFGLMHKRMMLGLVYCQIFNECHNFSMDAVKWLCKTSYHTHFDICTEELGDFSIIEEWRGINGKHKKSKHFLSQIGSGINVSKVDMLMRCSYSKIINVDDAISLDFDGCPPAGA